MVNDFIDTFKVDLRNGNVYECDLNRYIDETIESNFIYLANCYTFLQEYLIRNFREAIENGCETTQSISMFYFKKIIYDNHYKTLSILHETWLKKCEIETELEIFLTGGVAQFDEDEKQYLYEQLEEEEQEEYNELEYQLIECIDVLKEHDVL